MCCWWDTGIRRLYYWSSEKNNRKRNNEYQNARISSNPLSFEKKNGTLTIHLRCSIIKLSPIRWERKTDTQRGVLSGLSRKRHLRSKIWWFTEFCNSHYISHFAAFFIVTRTEISAVKSCVLVFDWVEQSRPSINSHRERIWLLSIHSPNQYKNQR